MPHKNSTTRLRISTFFFSQIFISIQLTVIVVRETTNRSYCLPVTVLISENLNIDQMQICSITVNTFFTKPQHHVWYKETSQHILHNVTNTDTCMSGVCVCVRLRESC